VFAAKNNFPALLGTVPVRLRVCSACIKYELSNKVDITEHGIHEEMDPSWNRIDFFGGRN